MRTAGFIVLVAVAQQAAAHGWTGAPAFSCPSNTNNLCDSDQQRGFDWSKGDLNQYGDFSFSSFAIVSTFNNKRDLSPRTNKFQDKCIKGSVAKDTSAPPKISCGSGKSFSISEIEVTTSEDTDLEFVYGYDNGDTCKQTSSCSKSGSTVKNSQCGGATSVTFKIPKNAKHDKCDVGVHRVNFDCGPPTLPSTPPTSVSVSKSSTSVIHSSSTHSFSQSHTITGNLSSHAATGTAPATRTIPVTLPISSSTPASSLASSIPTSTEASTPISVPASSSASSTPISSEISTPASVPASSSAASTPASSEISTPASVTTSSSASSIPASSEVSTPASVLASSSGSSTPVSSEVSTPASVPASSSGSSTLVSSEVSTPASVPASSSGSSTPVSSEVSTPASVPASSSAFSTSASSEVSTPVSVPASSSASSTASGPASSTPASSTEAFTTTLPVVVSSTASTYPISSPVSSAPIVATSVLSSTASPPASSAVASSATEALSTPATSSVPEVTQPIVTTQVVVTTVTTCPVTNTVTSGTTQILQSSFTVSTILSTLTSTICTKCVAPKPTTPASSAVSIPSSSLATVPGTSATASGTQSSGFATTPSVPATTQDVVTTQIIRTTLTTCPVTETITSGSSQSIRVTQTVSVIRNTVTSTICTKCVAPPNTQAASSTPASEPSSSPTGPPPVPVPSVLPKCMNTWITLTNCENNADADCYCKDSEFTKNVQDCVGCWSEDSTVIQAALSYLAGICAPAVKANPGIITNIPSTITLGPNATPPPVSSASLLASAGSITPPVPVSIPVTTISLVKTVTIPISFTTGPSVGQAIPSSFTTSVISTEVTVPQVKFTTDTLPPGVTGSPDVGLVGGVPASVSANPTTFGLSTFATGRLATGAQPTVGTSALPFLGSATRTGSGIFGALFVGALGLLMGL